LLTATTVTELTQIVSSLAISGLVHIAKFIIDQGKPQQDATGFFFLFWLSCRFVANGVAGVQFTILSLFK
jgi:hypothetical protein